MLLAAARRFVSLLAGVAAATVLVSLALGALAGSGVSRSISLGFYLVGSFLLVGGFFIGNRGPLRSVGDQGLLSFWGRRGIRPASSTERREELNASVFYIVTGLFLLAFGVMADSRFSLF